VYSGILRHDSNEKRGSGRPKLIWKAAVKGNSKGWNITKDLALNSSA
jgi:predicted ArsR family transcriptional regulator